MAYYVISSLHLIILNLGFIKAQSSFQRSFRTFKRIRKEWFQIKLGFSDWQK